MGYEQLGSKDALKSLFDAAKTVSENVFTNDRPAAVPKQMDNFIVVSLPGLLSSMTYGSELGMSVPVHVIVCQTEKGRCGRFGTNGHYCRRFSFPIPHQRQFHKCLKPQIDLERK